MLTLRGLAQQPVARMEQSGTREPGQLVSQSKMMKNDDPDFAALHPGYLLYW